MHPVFSTIDYINFLACWDCMVSWENITWCQSSLTYPLWVRGHIKLLTMSQTASGFATPPLNLASESLPNAFRSFRRYCELVFTVPYAKLSEKEKVTYVLLWIGRYGLDVYNAWLWENEADKHNLTPLWEHFETHIEPKVNSFLAHYDFHQCRQKIQNLIDRNLRKGLATSASSKFTTSWASASGFVSDKSSFLSSVQLSTASSEHVISIQYTVKYGK